MQITYIKNRKTYKTKESNNDLDININEAEGRYRVDVTAKKDLTLVSVTHSVPFHVNFKDRYFLNGYQSWTDSHEYSLFKRLRNIKKSPHIISRLFAMKSYGDSIFYKYSIRKSHGYDFFYSKGNYESFVINLIPNIAYLIIELVKNNRNIHLISDVNGMKLTEGESSVVLDYYFVNSYQEGLLKFNSLYPKKNIEKLFGYTSWYNYYQNINEEIILRDLDALDERFNLFQIDDGYETFVGDWLDVDPNKFPNGLEPIVERIHSRGFKAGLWLAPFVAEEKSKLFKQHNDWIKRDAKGKLVKSGGNWSGHYALDLGKKEVRDYIRKSLEHYMELGFDFFKLDFLYAAGIVVDKNKTRSQTQREAYEFLREVLKDKLILGCGANIANSIDIFDYLRVGPDVSLEFDDVAYMRLFHRERISTKVTIQNTIYRSFFNERLFANDPDVFLLRDGNIKLNEKQREALTKINALFGSLLMTSDNISGYHKIQNKVLKQALDMFRHGEVISFEANANKIKVIYKINNDNHELLYDTKKGVLDYDR